MQLKRVFTVKQVLCMLRERAGPGWDFCLQLMKDRTVFSPLWHPQTSPIGS